MQELPPIQADVTPRRRREIIRELKQAHRQLRLAQARSDNGWPLGPRYKAKGRR